jgi:hypothetical protein
VSLRKIWESSSLVYRVRRAGYVWSPASRPTGAEAASTPAPLFPDDSFTFDFETGLANDVPFSDGFSQPSCDLDSLFTHEGDTLVRDAAIWNPDWSGPNPVDAINDYTSLMSSSDGFGVGLEEFWTAADSSLAHGSVSAAADSPPVHLWSSDDNGSGKSASFHCKRLV